MPGLEPRKEVEKLYTWPAESWKLDNLLGCGPREDWTARLTSVGGMIRTLELESVGQASNTACLCEEEAWSLGIWREHTSMHVWTQRRPPSFVAALLKLKVERITEFQKEWRCVKQN